MALKSYKKAYNTLTFKERLIHHLHNELIFGCSIELKEDEFHTCKECERKANNILMFFEYEIGRVRQEKI